MKVPDFVKNSLIADVENILAIHLSQDQKRMLSRCFEITLGVNNEGQVLGHNALMNFFHEYQQDFDKNNSWHIERMRGIRDFLFYVKNQLYLPHDEG